MKKMKSAESPAAFVAALDGWRRRAVVSLRTGVRAAGSLEEVVKWGNLVYRSNGPVLMIRAEAHRVLFGFWRGRLLVDLEPRLKPGGKYDMATMEIREGDAVPAATVRRLTKKAVALNRTLGDPTLAAKPAAKHTAKRGAKR